MKTLIQKVKEASVKIDGQTVSRIGPGVLVFLGITHGDGEKEADALAKKIANLRLFKGESEKSVFDKSVLETSGEVLVVSQFTLYGSCKKGRRPDFTDAACPEIAEPLYKYFVERLQGLGARVATGQFGAYMHVSLVNDGPVTLMLEAENDKS
jgi:D-tyrosyl-tRNA(Tyr) deacylase